MDLATLIQKVLDLVKAVRAATSFADYLALLPQVLALIQLITANLPGPTPGPVVMMATQAGPIEDCCAALENCCNQHAANSSAAPTAGGFITLLLPILLDLLKALLTK
jgi:hypothetical protein